MYKIKSINHLPFSLLSQMEKGWGARRNADLLLHFTKTCLSQCSRDSCTDFCDELEMVFLHCDAMDKFQIINYCLFLTSSQFY